MAITNTPSPQALPMEGSTSSSVEPAQVQSNPSQAAATKPQALGISDITNASEGSGLANVALNQRGLGFDLSAAGESYINALGEGSVGQLKEVAAKATAILNLGGQDMQVQVPDAQNNALQSRWSDFMSEMAVSGGAVDVNALVQWVLRESYQESTNDLRFYAEKVQFYNDVKKDIRAELTRARDALAEHAGAEDDAALSYTPTGINTTFAGAQESAAAPAPDAPTTKAELESYIQGLEEKLSSVGDDAQLANVDLQNMLQKQQQVMQMMSNISKMLHDTAMAIIRKIG